MPSNRSEPKTIRLNKRILNAIGKISACKTIVTDDMTTEEGAWVWILESANEKERATALEYSPKERADRIKMALDYFDSLEDGDP